MSRWKTILAWPAATMLLLALGAGCASMHDRWSLPSQRPLSSSLHSAAASSAPPEVGSGATDPIHIEIPDDLPEFQNTDDGYESERGAAPEAEQESTPYRTAIRGQSGRSG